MDDLVSQLLKLKDSELGRYLHHDLCGLCAALTSALEARPDDSGSFLCQNLIDRLNQLLQESFLKSGQLYLNDDSSVSEHTHHRPLSVSPATEKLYLSNLRETFFSDENIQLYIGEASPQSTQDAELWNEIQKLLLRVPEMLADDWQHKALKLAQDVGAAPDSSQVITLPFSQDNPDYPSLSDYPGLQGTVEAQGLLLSTSAALDEGLRADNLSSDLKFLAEVVSICLHFIDTDQHLQHCLKSLFQFGVTRLNSKQRSQYRKVLITRFHRVRDSDDNPIAALKARLDLDEAIHSLVYLPLVEPSSWWSKLQQAARKSLDPAVARVRQAGYDAGHQWLLGVREDIINYTEDDVPYPDNTAYLPQDRGIPGKVMACLRVYAWINHEKLRGRVIFFPR